MVIQDSSEAIMGDVAPLEARDLEPVLRSFGESRMLPREAYVSEAVFAWEQRNFFGRGWVCVGRSDSLPDPGDQRAESVGPAGVFLTATPRASSESSRTRAGIATMSSSLAVEQRSTVRSSSVPITDGRTG